MAGSMKDRPTRVLFLQTQAEMAGAQEVSRLLGEELARSGDNGEPGFEVHHLFLYRKTAGCDHFPNVHFAARQRPASLSSGLKLVTNLLSTIRDIRPDVLLTFQHYGNVIGAPVGRIAGVPRIIANHVSAPLTINGIVRRVDRIIGLVGCYDAITVNSHATWRDYSAYPARYKRRVVHIPHGFAPRPAFLPKSDARRHFGLPSDAPLMGTVARLHPLKQIDLAIRTLTSLKRVHLAIAGQGPDRARLDAVATELGVKERVHFVGEMQPSSIGDFLSGLDLFVFPSAAETFGLAAVEAAQAGVPVIANELPVLKEVLAIDGLPCAVFVDATDTASLSALIDRLLNDKQQSEELSARGRKLSERYSLASMVREYRHLISDQPNIEQSNEYGRQTR